jgi:hypothetical protein
MCAKPDDYFQALGKLLFATSLLEEAMVVFSMALSEPADVNAFDAELRRKSWATNTKGFRALIKERFSEHYQGQLLPLLERTDRLRRDRNKNIHALWQIMVNAETGQYVNVVRVTRTREGETSETKISTPSPAELDKLANDLRECGQTLQNAFKHAFDLDEKVQRWWAGVLSRIR